MIKIKSTVLAAIIIFIASMLLAEEASNERVLPPSPKPPIYMVEYDAGPSYLPGRPFSEQPGIRRARGIYGSAPRRRNPDLRRSLLR